MYWFTLQWWKLLLGKPSYETSRWTAFWCRARGHTSGVIWYTGPEDLEPNMTCKKCFDYLG
jgi:hypothetical protein